LDESPRDQVIGSGDAVPDEAVAPRNAAERLDVKPCRCGHGKTAHEHYRRGADCSLCSCTRYRRGWWSRLPLIGG
jgi:hypothetical protein